LVKDYKMLKDYKISLNSDKGKYAVMSTELEIKFLNENNLQDYVLNDEMHGLFKPSLMEEGFAENLGCNNWLVQSPSKRLIFNELYSDLLLNAKTENFKILDIGAGINLAQKIIAAKNSYTIIDLLAHDKTESARKFCSENDINLLIGDWYHQLSKFKDIDVIICNDLFPNVDQRLQEFIQLALQHSPNAELRMSLTFYQKSRFYNVKRVDAEEFMCLRAWTGEDCMRALEKAGIKLTRSQCTNFINFKESIFPNGRTVATLKCRFT
jgi:hypothetical protein